MNHLGLLFYSFSAVAVASSLIVVTNRRPAYSVLALTLTMLALSALFVLLEAYFVAVIQVLIYAGAILVLFLFVVMLLGIEATPSPLSSPPFRGRGKDEEVSLSSRLQSLIPVVLSAVLLIEFAFAILQMPPPQQAVTKVAGNTEAIGEALLTQYLLPFELVSGILLIGIFGVVNLAYKGQKK